jgi:proteic killer suppression protein
VQVIQGFRDKATEDIRNGKASRAARNRLPTTLWRTAARKFDQIHRVLELEELRIPPGNHFEALRGDRQGQHAIRINEQYRICFVWGPDGPDQVEVADYH